MKKILVYNILLVSISSMLLGSATQNVGSAIVSDDEQYYTYDSKVNNLQIIYPEENLKFARHVASMEAGLHKDLSESFDWKLDEKLYVSLISNHNQIANGFSTQFPNNRQVNYSGGMLYIDYFSTTSWLDTLIYHETTHNYQLNVKGSKVSQKLHSVLGNSFINGMLTTVPNIFENSFMLEGNAVLNESWHGNGGRLYSGRFKAGTILQAKAGNITPQRGYNKRLGFPYGEIHYIQGGFYQLYMAEKYGIKAMNSYFKYYSKHWAFPHYTNSSMKDATGVDFETSLKEFSDTYAKMADDLVQAKGDVISSSQFFTSLGRDNDEIFFLTNPIGVNTLELVVLDKNTNNIKRIKGNWLGGKVLKADGKYYTQAGAHTDVNMIEEGLFNKNAIIKDNTSAKIIQGYLKDGTEVYFDVPTSYSQPQLYIGDKFYAQVNSSVMIDNNDNIYYFIQKGKKRTLYKNKTPLYTYKGFYGFVSDIDSKGVVYFIANSKLGSTLYKYKNKKVTRASAADNIVEAKLINNSEILITAISANDYYSVKNNIVNIKQEPYETILFHESKSYYGPSKGIKTAQKDYKDMDLANKYNPITSMHYSGIDIQYASTPNGIEYDITANLGDPLTQNGLEIKLMKNDENITLFGAAYANKQHLIEYSIGLYGVVNDDDTDTRDSSIAATAKLPLYQRGYKHMNLASTYFEDYDTKDRKPLTLTLSAYEANKVGSSMYYNYYNGLDMYMAKERSDNLYGLNYNFKSELPYESYFAFSGKYTGTNSDITETIASDEKRGVKVSNNIIQLDNDNTAITMKTIENTQYFKNVGYAEIGLYKVFNFSKYYFTFPLSLQRESVYAKYRHYSTESFDNTVGKENIIETTVGITLSTVILNNMVMPISIEYVNNDSGLAKDKEQILFTINMAF